MEEKRINEQESLAIITEMIQATKQMATVANVNLMLMWGWLSVATSLLVYAGLMLTHNPLCNLLWWAIPLVGWGVMAYVLLKEKRTQRVTTYMSKAFSTMWGTTGITFGLLMLGCFAANIFSVNLWPLMYVLSLPIVGIATIAGGAILRMRSFLIGGTLTTLIGAASVAILLVTGSLPPYTILLFAAGFFTAFIIPGYCLKNKKDERA